MEHKEKSKDTDTSKAIAKPEHGSAARDSREPREPPKREIKPPLLSDSESGEEEDKKAVSSLWRKMQVAATLSSESESGEEEDEKASFTETESGEEEDEEEGEKAVSSLRRKVQAAATLSSESESGEEEDEKETVVQVGGAIRQRVDFKPSQPPYARAARVRVDFKRSHPGQDIRPKEAPRRPRPQRDHDDFSLPEAPRQRVDFKPSRPRPGFGKDSKNN